MLLGGHRRWPIGAVVCAAESIRLHRSIDKIVFRSSVRSLRSPARSTQSFFDLDQIPSDSSSVVPSPSSHYMVGGTRWVENACTCFPRAGSRPACNRPATGLGSLALNRPSTTRTAHVTWPLVGEVHPRHRGDLHDLGACSRWWWARLLLLLTAIAWSLRAPPRQDRPRRVEGRLMEVVISIAIGVMASAGVVAGAAARTFQVLIGLTLLSYAVNLFIFSVGSLAIGREPIVRGGRGADLVSLQRPAAAVAGVDHHRHRLRDDGVVPGRVAGAARPVPVATTWTGGRNVHDGGGEPPAGGARPAAAGHRCADTAAGRAGAASKTSPTCCRPPWAWRWP